MLLGSPVNTAISPTISPDLNLVTGYTSPWDDAFFWAASDHGPDLAIADIAEIILGNYA